MFGRRFRGRLLRLTRLPQSALNGLVITIPRLKAGFRHFGISVHSESGFRNMSSRRRAREIVLQMLYEADINGSRDPEAMHRFIRSRMHGHRALSEFGIQLLEGTLQVRDEVDQHLGNLAKGWSLSRMAVIDRNIMRLAGYEMLREVTPGRVAINEAVLLAKRYGEETSPRFVNGILDRLMKQFESEGEPS